MVRLCQTQQSEADGNIKLQKLLYLLRKTLPLLGLIQEEQTSELTVEANIRGIEHDNYRSKWLAPLICHI